jgi:hypothetical protein
VTVAASMIVDLSIIFVITSPIYIFLIFLLRLADDAAYFSYSSVISELFFSKDLKLDEEE